MKNILFVVAVVLAVGNLVIIGARYLPVTGKPTPVVVTAGTPTVTPVTQELRFLSTVPASLQAQMLADPDFLSVWGTDADMIASFCSQFEATSKKKLTDSQREFIRENICPRVKGTFYQAYKASGDNVYKAMAPYLVALTKASPTIAAEVLSVPEPATVPPVLEQPADNG